MNLERLHVRIFGHEMSVPMRGFLGTLSWSFAGGIAGAGMLAIASVAVARLLGPEDFGRASLVVANANLLMMLCILGLDGASTRVISRARESESGRAAGVSSSAFVIVCLLVVMGSALAILAPYVAPALDTTTASMLGAVLLGVALTARFHADKFTAALGWFRLQTIGRVVEGAIVLGVVITMALTSSASWEWYARALGAGALTAGLILLLAARRYLRPHAISRDALRELWAFSKWGLVGTVFPLAIVFGDKLVIQIQLGATELGRYTAYQTVSLLVVAQLVAIISNAFLPAVVRAEDKRPIVAKLWRLSKLAAAPVLIALGALIGLARTLYGDGYDITFVSALGFASYGTLYLFNGLFRNIVIPHSERTYFLSVLFQAVRAIIFVACMTVAIVTGQISLAIVIWTLVLIEVLESWNFATIIRRHIIPA